MNKYGKEITLEQLAKELKTSKEDIAMALDSARPVNSIEDSQYRDNEKEVILLRYYKGKTQMQVAKILGITQVQVSRIERKVLDNMKRKLTV